MMYQDEWSLKNVSPAVMGLTGTPLHWLNLKLPYHPSIFSRVQKIGHKFR